MSEIDKDLLQLTIDKWGKPLQEVMAIEEMSELTKELSKSLRGIGHNNRTEEEIADVIIMIEQLKIIYDKRNIDKWIVFKMERLKNMLEESNK